MDFIMNHFFFVYFMIGLLYMIVNIQLNNEKFWETINKNGVADQFSPNVVVLVIILVTAFVYLLWPYSMALKIYSKIK